MTNTSCRFEYHIKNHIPSHHLPNTYLLTNRLPLAPTARSANTLVIWISFMVEFRSTRAEFVSNIMIFRCADECHNTNPGWREAFRWRQMKISNGATCGCQSINDFKDYRRLNEGSRISSWLILGCQCMPIDDVGQTICCFGCSNCSMCNPSSPE